MAEVNNWAPWMFQPWKFFQRCCQLVKSILGLSCSVACTPCNGTATTDAIVRYYTTTVSGVSGGHEWQGGTTGTWTYYGKCCEAFNKDWELAMFNCTQTSTPCCWRDFDVSTGSPEFCKPSGSIFSGGYQAALLTIEDAAAWGGTASQVVFVLRFTVTSSSAPTCASPGTTKATYVSDYIADADLNCLDANDLILTLDSYDCDCDENWIISWDTDSSKVPDNQPTSGNWDLTFDSSTTASQSYTDVFDIGGVWNNILNNLSNLDTGYSSFQFKFDSTLEVEYRRIWADGATYGNQDLSGSLTFNVDTLDVDPSFTIQTIDGCTPSWPSTLTLTPTDEI